MKAVNGHERKPIFYCTFCGKNQHEVYRLFAAATCCMICDECVDLCAGIVADARKADQDDTKERSDG